jgi:hypothetical protein
MIVVPTRDIEKRQHKHPILLQPEDQKTRSLQLLYLGTPSAIKTVRMLSGTHIPQCIPSRKPLPSTKNKSDPSSVVKLVYRRKHRFERDRGPTGWIIGSAGLKKKGLRPAVGGEPNDRFVVVCARCPID